MRHLYGMQKTAAQKKAAFARALADFMRADREAAAVMAKAASDRKAFVTGLIRKYSGKTGD